MTTRYIIAISRLLVGLLFIFSGFIKANDPLGFSYKLDDYFDVFSMAFMKPSSLVLSMFICVFEIALGISVILGTFINFTTWMLLLMITFFTGLTGYSAITGAVQDCGCFGDAIKLTPWESFFKDIVLFILIGVVFWNRNKIITHLTPKTAMLLIAISILGPSLFTYAAYSHLPFIDFRPYKIGNNIYELMQIPKGAPLDIIESTFYYKNKNTGEIKEFDINNLPSSEIWDFHDRADKVIQEGYKPPIHDFSISNADGDDLTEDYLLDNGYLFVLVSYDLSKACVSNAELINEIYKKSGSTYQFLAMTASTDEEINKYHEKTGSGYEFHFADATALKTIIRSNPGLLLLKGGVVIEQWHVNDFPDMNTIKEKYILN